MTLPKFGRGALPAAGLCAGEHFPLCSWQLLPYPTRHEHLLIGVCFVLFILQFSLPSGSFSFVWDILTCIYQFLFGLFCFVVLGIDSHFLPLDFPFTSNF